MAGEADLSLLGARSLADRLLVDELAVALVVEQVLERHHLHAGVDRRDPALALLLGLARYYVAAVVAGHDVAVDQLARLDVALAALRLDDERVLAEALLAELDRNDLQALERNDALRVLVLR